MDGLRWILLVAGLIVIAGVILFSRRNASGASDGTGGPRATSAKRVEPVLGGKSQPPAADHDPQTEGAAEEGREPPEVPADAFSQDPGEAAGSIAEQRSEQHADVEQKIVTVRVVAQNKVPFAGDRLVLALRGIGLRHGRFGIFHQYDGADEDRVIFSVASLVEPGTFQLDNLREQKIPGISIFMVLPGPLDGAVAFDRMMSAARSLTQSLGGELLDETGSSLSIQRERYLREEIIQYQLENRLG